MASGSGGSSGGGGGSGAPAPAPTPSRASPAAAAAPTPTPAQQRYIDMHRGGASFVDLHAAGASASDLRAAGARVADLRTPRLRVAPADLRAGGYTFAEMEVCLGPHLLREAGFTPAHMRAGGLGVELVLGCGFDVADALAGGYAVSEVVAVLPRAGLTAAGLTAADIVVAGGTRYWALRAKGYSADELAAAGAPRPPCVVPPPDVRLIDGRTDPAARAAALHVGDSYSLSATGDSSSTLEVELRRVSAADAAAMRPHAEWLVRGPCAYAGSGRLCHSCGGVFVLVVKDASNDDWISIDAATWVCDTPGCGLVKSETYRGYGGLFWGWEELYR